MDEMHEMHEGQEDPYLPSQSELGVSAPSFQRVAAEGMGTSFPSFRRRLAAHLIDIFFVCLLMLLIGALGPRIKSLGILVAFLQGFSFYFYSLFFLIKSGQTPGKRLMKIKVVGTTDGPLDFAQCLRRNLIWFIGSLPWVFATTIAILQIPSDQYYGIVLQRKAYHQLVESLRPDWMKFADYGMGIICSTDILLVLITKKRQSLHDFLGGTVVVRIPNK